MKRILIPLLWLCYVNNSIAQPIPVDKLFKDDFFINPKISISGEKLSSYIFLDNGEKLLVAYDFELKKFSQLAIFKDDVKLDNYQWLDDNSLFLTITHKKIIKNMLITLTIEQGEIVAKGSYLPWKGRYTFGYVVDLLPNEKDTIILGVYDDPQFRYERKLYQVQLKDLINFDKSNWSAVKHPGDGLIAYGYDGSRRRYISINIVDDKLIYKYKLRDDTGIFSDWTDFFVIDMTDEKYDFSPIQLLDDDTLAVLTNHDSDKVSLQKFHIKEKRFTPVYEDSNYDLVNAHYSLEGELVSVSYFKNGQYYTHFFNTEHKQFYAKLEKAFPNKQISFANINDASNKAIILVSADNDPGAYYMFDANEQKAELISAAFPKLEPYRMAKTTALTVEVEPDVTVEAYLTKPAGVDLNTLLVMPHGGPVGVRDLVGYSPSLQYFASRGFTILRVNFRGSAGFGKKFVETGVGEFGQLIEHDISKAVDQVMQNKHFDSVCSIGTSYGGYSAMMLAIKHPDLYKCVIAQYGVYDLPLLFAHYNYEQLPTEQKAIESVVGENKPELVDVSPVYLANKITQPVLLIAGEKDLIAAVEQSYRMKYVLEKLNKPIDSLFYKDVGHGYHKLWTGDRHEHAYIYDFLVKTLGLPKMDENSKDENIQHILKTEADLLKKTKDLVVH